MNIVKVRKNISKSSLLTLIDDAKANNEILYINGPYTHLIRLAREIRSDKKDDRYFYFCEYVKTKGIVVFFSLQDVKLINS